MRRLLWLAALFGTSTAAWAVPVGKIIDLDVGEVRILGPDYVQAAEIDPPDLCAIERRPTLEFALTPKRPGTALLFLYEDGHLAVDRLRIHDPRVPAPEAPPGDGFAARFAAAKAVCQQVAERVVDGDRFLHVEIQNARCREAARSLLATDRYLAGELRITFSVEGVQAQLAAMQARLAQAGIHGLALSYLGMTLTLRGAVAAATVHRALRELWPVAVGRIDLEDRTEPPDGGGS